MNKSIFYHAGCPVCVSAEHDLLNLIDPESVEIIHLGENKEKLGDAQAAGLKSVPALVTPSGNVLHINFGAALSDLQG
ncbi:MAG: thioredoxin family protein [Reichenbachiella sp.]|uniref:thioredoxin family protein n=1 Tax=Reichenbachiella sp. TaxID=2184521 RepID=UPI003264AE32